MVSQISEADLTKVQQFARSSGHSTNQGCPSLGILHVRPQSPPFLNVNHDLTSSGSFLEPTKWAVIETNISIVAANVPCLNPLFKAVSKAITKVYRSRTGSSSQTVLPEYLLPPYMHRQASGQRRETIPLPPWERTTQRPTPRPPPMPGFGRTSVENS